MLIEVPMTWHKNQFNIWSIIGSFKFWILTTVLEMQIFLLNFSSGWNGWQWPGVICVHWICEQSADCVLWLPAWPVSLKHWSPGIHSFSWPSAVPAAWRISATCSGKPDLTALQMHGITWFCMSGERKGCPAIFHLCFVLHRIQILQGRSSGAFFARWLILEGEGKVQEHLCL